MIIWGDQFVLDLLFSDALFEGLQGFVVQCVFLESEACQPHPVGYFLVCLYHSSFDLLHIGSTKM